MKMNVEEIALNGYELTDCLDHDALIPFLNQKLQLKKSLAYYVYLVFLMLPLAALSYTITYFAAKGELALHTTILHVVLGIVFVLAFIPIHELLHWVAYKLVGAQKVSFQANFKKLYFLTVANKFVTNSSEFRLVATLPFLSATLLAIFAIAFSGVYWSITWIVFLLIHNFFCGGDFILLNFMENNRKQGIITYDDTEKKVSYFFLKNQQAY
jgi:hypothetical protein